MVPITEQTSQLISKDWGNVQKGIWTQYVGLVRKSSFHNVLSHFCTTNFSRICHWWLIHELCFRGGGKKWVKKWMQWLEIVKLEVSLWAY